MPDPPLDLINHKAKASPAGETVQAGMKLFSSALNKPAPQKAKVSRTASCASVRLTRVGPG
jgi:hypothetical protein